MQAKCVVVALGVLALACTEAAAVAPAPPVSIEVLRRTPTSALIRWTPSSDQARGFKVRSGKAAGVHPDPVSYPGGKLAAFTWTTDDGLRSNLVYDQIFASRGLNFTTFINPGLIGSASTLSWSDVRFLHTQGHEIANHGRDHLALIDDRALALRYVGPLPCEVEVQGTHLVTSVNGAPDLDLTLTDPEQDHLVELASVLDAHPRYECTLLYSDLETYATQSIFLDSVTIDIGYGAPAGTLTTDRGVHDDVELAEQIAGGLEIESQIAPVDPTYRCRSFAYPNHAHTQWAMSALNEAGCVGARSGPCGKQPFFSQGSYALGYMTSYEAPLNYPRPNNGWSESFTRSQYQQRIADWKAQGTWAVLMAHGEAESDSAHVDWMLDEIAADPDVWIAPFGEVMTYLNTYSVDVGLPVDPSTGTASAWIHDLEPGATCHLVVTAYNDVLEESAWSEEITIPAWYSVGAPAVGPAPGPALTVAPNPFARDTNIHFVAPTSGPVRVDLFDVRGARVHGRDAGVLGPGRQAVPLVGVATTLPAGVYFVRVAGPGWSARGRAHLVR